MALYQYRNVTITVQPGNIVQEPAEGLMTLINSSGLWFGGVDRAIRAVAGKSFHQIAAQQMPRQVQQGAVIFADGSSIQHRGAFHHVIFVIDDLQLPLQELVKAGLREVYARNLGSVSLPMMRTGVMKGMVEKTQEEVVGQMAEAIKQMADAYPDKSLEIRIVIYADAETWQGKLLTSLARSRSPQQLNTVPSLALSQHLSPQK